MESRPVAYSPCVAVVGCGYWGKNLVRNFHRLGALRAVCETDPAGRERAASIAPGVEIWNDLESALRSSEAQGIALATPAVTHLPLALRCFEAGKDVFVEKPMAMNVAEGRRMIEAARAAGRILMVGHILEYHPAILALRGLIDAGELGRIRYLYSNRLNFGKIRTEENALWSFAPHDIAVILRLIGKMPEEVSCRGSSFVSEPLADVTVSTLHFPENIHAHVFVSWLNPVKEQRLVVVGSNRMAVFNDVSREDKLVLYNQHVTIENGTPVLHQRDLQTVPIPSAEPLTEECRDFLDCMKTRKDPLSNGESGLNVLQVLEACQTSMNQHGLGVRLPVA